MPKNHRTYMRIKSIFVAPTVCSTLSHRKQDEGWRVRGKAARVEMRQRRDEPVLGDTNVRGPCLQS